METINHADREWMAITVEPSQITIEGAYRPTTKTYTLYTLRINEELRYLQTVYITNLDKWMVVRDVLGDGVYNVWIDECCVPTDISDIDAGTKLYAPNEGSVCGKPWNRRSQAEKDELIKYYFK